MKNISEQAMLKNKVKSARFGCANGGMAKRQGQGLIHGPGTGTSDSVPIDLPSGAKIAASDKEFIFPADSTAKLGAHNLQAMVDATHKRVPMANGGLYSQISDELRRGRTGPVTVAFGTGRLGAQDASNPGTPGLAPVTDITALSGQSAGTGRSVPNTTDMSLALPKTAVPGITPIAQYGGMDNTAALTGKRVINAGPTVEVPEPQYADGGQVEEPPAPQKKQVSQLALDALQAPVQDVRRLHNEYTSFGYADGGAVDALKGRRSRLDEAEAAMVQGKPAPVAAPKPAPVPPKTDGILDTIKKAIFGERKPMQHGGVPVPYDPVFGRRFAPGSEPYIDVTPEPEPLGKAPPNAGMRAEAAKAARAAAQAATAQTAPASAAAPEAPVAPKSAFGNAKAGVGKWIGRGAAGIGAAYSGMDMAENGVNAGNVGSMVGAGLLAVPHPYAKVAGLALQFGSPFVQAAFDKLKAQGAGNPEPRAGDVDENTMLRNDAAGVPRVGAPNPNDRFSDARYDAQHGMAQSSALSTSNEVPSTQSYTQAQDKFLTEAGVPPRSMGAAPFGGNAEQRGQFVRGETPADPSGRTDGIYAGPGAGVDRTKYQNLGDYGAPGTHIFGRSTNGSAKLNDFVGVGGLQPVPNNGVTLGIKPEDLEAYKAGAAGAQFGGLRPPEYYVSPETQKLHGLMGPMAERLAAMRPGDPGRKRLTAQLEALNTAASGLQSADTLQNTHAMAAFGHVAGLQQHQMTMNNNLSLKRGELNLGQSRLDQEWAVKKAERDNAQREFVYQHGKDAKNENEKLAQNYAAAKFPGDKAKQEQYAGALGMLLTTRGYEDPTDLDESGKPKTKSFHEFDRHSRGLLMGDIDKLMNYNMERLSTGKPMDPMGQDADRPAGLGETARYAIRHAEPGLIPRQIFYGTRRAPDGTIIKNPDLTTSYSQ